MAARAIGDVMQRELGQPWIVDSKPGANGLIAAKSFLDAPPDSPILYLTVLSHVLLPFVMKVPFDVLADFQPVAMLGTSTALVCVPARATADTMTGFIDRAHTHHDSLNYLNPGNGTVSHLVPEILKTRFELSLTPVYYKTVQQGIGDLVAGDLDLGVVATGLALPHVQQGRLKAIAQIGSRRLDTLPNVATLDEQGLGDLQVRSFLPLYGRTAMNSATVARINRAVAVALADQRTLERFAAAQIEPLSMSAFEVGETMRHEHDRLGAVVQQLGIRSDDQGGLHNDSSLRDGDRHRRSSQLPASR